MFRYFTLDNLDFKNKIVGVRIDINSPIKNKKIILNERIIKSAITIKELIKKGAKIVLLAHQGRTGKDDCISLKEHSKLLSKEVQRNINFISEIYSKNIEKSILNLKSGEVILLENLRFYDDELNIKKKGNLILKLEKIFDFYIFDAFSVAHREQTSVIGFKNIINIAGRLMEKELKGLSKIGGTKHPKVFIFGGAKSDDLVELMEISLKKNEVDLVLLSGVIGEIALHIKGFYLGKKLSFFKKNNYLNSLDRIKKLLEIYEDKIVFPSDVALFDGKKRVEISIDKLYENKKLLEKYLVQDIGQKTIFNFSLFLKSAASIYFKGPPGNFEIKEFEYGTKNLLKEICKTEAFTYMGGGHSVTSASMFNFLDKFSYVSLAGGALVKFLSGQKLVGVEILEKSFVRFEHQYEDFIVVGSNTIDTYVSSDKHFLEMQIGDKIRIKDDFKTKVGGGGINVSICLSRLGVKVGYIGKISEEYSEKIRNILSKNKVNILTSKISKRPCAKSFILDTKDNDRIIYTYRGQNPYFSEEDFDVKCLNANYYYFNSLINRGFETLVKITKIVKKKNDRVKICYNPCTYLIRNEKSKLKILIKNIDVLVLNFEEAEEFTSKTRIGECLKAIFDLGPKIVVITDGSEGAYAYDGVKEFYQKAILTKKVVDTTGAGDSFASTFFYFYVKGFGISKSMLYAAKNSSSVISKKGAQDGLLYYEDLVK